MNPHDLGDYSMDYPPSERLKKRRKRKDETVPCYSETSPAGPSETQRESGRHAAPAREQIFVVRGALHKAVDQSINALARSGLGVYARGGLLVRPVKSPPPPKTLALKQEPVGNVLRPEGSITLSAVSPSALTEVISRCADFQRYDGRKKDNVAIDPPPEIARTIIDRHGDGWEAIPLLRAVVTAPTMRADGGLIVEPGYDRESGILFLTERQWRSVPDVPSKSDVLHAVDALFKPIRDLPFVDDSDIAAALALLVTAVVRPSLKRAPMFAVSAPSAGTGKSLAVDVAAILATGRSACVVAPSPDEAELEKRLGAAALAGDQVINIDNLTHVLRSDALCQILTQEEVAVRILGKSENSKISSTALIAATGNNLALYGDLNRRAIRIRLDAKSERPDERDFSWDPRTYAHQHRPELVAAALTIVRGYIVAGKPNPAPPMGSFEDWSGFVRSSLLWAGKADCRGNSEEFRADDPEKTTLAEIMDVLPDGAWTVKTVRNEAINNSELRAVLAQFLDRSGVLSSSKFGGYLRRYKDRPVNNRAIRLLRSDDKHGSTWWVEDVKNAWGDVG